MDFRVRTRVGKPFEEWRLRNAGTEKQQLGTAFKVDMAKLLSEIKLMGPHTEAGIRKLMLRVLPEFGVARDEVGTVADGILSEARRDALLRSVPLFCRPRKGLSR